MGGGALLNTAANKVKRPLTLTPTQASAIGLIPDTLACIFGSIANRTSSEAAENALDWYLQLHKRFAFVAVPGEGLAKAGKETRGFQPERQVLTPVFPLVGPPSYQGVRAAEQVMVEVHSSETVGKEKIPRFDVFKAIGDADSAQVYLSASFEARGIKCFDPLNLPGNPSSSSEPDSFKLLYDVGRKEEMSFADWDSLSQLLSDPQLDLDLDLSTELSSDLPLFVPPTRAPRQSSSPPLCFLPLTRDRDGVWSDAPYLALSIRLLPNSILLEYVNCRSVWEEAGSDALARYKKHRDSRVNSIRQNPARRDDAKLQPTSYDGRFLSAASLEPSSRDAALGVAFATAQNGDFGGLKPGSGVGIFTFLYLYLACQGDLTKIWETLNYHDIDTYFVRGIRSFYLPLVRQCIVFGVPSDPSDLGGELRQSDGSSNLRCGVYTFKNEVAATIRRQAIRCFYPRLLSLSSDLPLSPSDEDLDSPVIVMAALQYLEIVPSQGFKRETPNVTTRQRESRRDGSNETTSSPLSARSMLPMHFLEPSSPSSPGYSTDSSSVSSSSSPSNAISSYTTGLLDSPIKPPLHARLWSDQDHDFEGVGELRTDLLSKVTPSFNDSFESFPLLGPDVNESLSDMVDESEEGDDDDLEGSDGSQGDDEMQSEEDGEKRNVRKPNRIGEFKRSISVQLRKERAIQVNELISRKIPAVKQNVESLLKLSPFTLREAKRFLEAEEAEDAFVEKDGHILLLRSPYLAITDSFMNSRHARTSIRELLSHLGIGLTTKLVERMEKILDWGGLDSPAVNRQTILPLLFLRRNVPLSRNRGILQFIYITSLFREEWTSDSPPSLDRLQEALCKDAPHDSPVYCEDRPNFRSALSQLRLLAGLFDLAPPALLSTLNERHDLPAFTESELEDRLGLFFRSTHQQRHLVSVTQLRTKIYEVGGPFMYGDELGSLPSGGSGMSEIRLQLLRHCWKWMEDLVEKTVGEERFEEVFGPRIDWERSEQGGYIVTRKA